MISLELGGEVVEVRVIDADAHIHETPAALAEHCGQPWQRALQNMIDGSYNDILGLSHMLQPDPPFPGTIPGRVTRSSREMCRELALLGVDAAILYPDNLLFIGTLADRSYAASVAEAYNRWLIEEVVAQATEVDLYAAVLAVPSVPSEAARSIRMFGDHANVVAVVVPVLGASPPLGDHVYDPIYQAASDKELPVVFHSAQAIFPTFPFNVHDFSVAMARHTITHPFSIMATLVSVMSTGVPARFPVKLGFVEGGFMWLPFLMGRLDREYLSQRRQMPLLQQVPSAYLKTFRYSSQPLELPSDAEEAVALLRSFDADRYLMFATDWPHHDFDHPQSLARLPLRRDELDRIFRENAEYLFRLPSGEGRRPQDLLGKASQ